MQGSFSLHSGGLRSLHSGPIYAVAFPGRILVVPSHHECVTAGAKSARGTLRVRQPSSRGT